MIELNNVECKAVAGGNAVMVYPVTKEEAQSSMIIAMGATMGLLGAYCGGLARGPAGALAGAVIGAFGVPLAIVGVCNGLAASYRYLGII